MASNTYLFRSQWSQFGTLTLLDTAASLAPLPLLGRELHNCISIALRLFVS